LDLLWDTGSNATVDPNKNAAYRHKWTTPVGGQRWDGTLVIRLDGVQAAVTSLGIIWDTNFTPAQRLITVDGKFLIGTARVTGTDDQMLKINLDTRAGGVGKNIARRYGGYFTDDGVWHTLDVTEPDVLPARLLFIPEPLSILLVLTGMLLRRR
jgi:hypothetical protein